MTRIGLISDTHGYLDQQVFKYFEECNEIWHAGDFGNISIAEQIKERTQKPLKGVYGNIDGNDIRSVYPDELHFTVEEVRVFMIHIGGHPSKYAPGIKKEIIEHQSGLFICGHSHILKIIYDEKVNCLHINPGAAGNQGWHKVRTIVRFSIDKDKMKDCEVIELGSRSLVR